MTKFRTRQEIEQECHQSMSAFPEPLSIELLLDIRDLLKLISSHNELEERVRNLEEWKEYLNPNH